jgi:rhamnosyltransferase
MTHSQELAIHAIIVSYEPNIDVFARSLNAIQHQVSKVWVVDNSVSSISQDDVRKLCADKAEVLSKSTGNIGLAAAQNLAIDHAFTKGASYVLLLDQDTVAMPYMVTELLNSFRSSNYPMVAAAGPSVNDVRTNSVIPFVRFNRWRIIRKVPSNIHLQEVDFLISSGMLISRNSWQSVGPMPHDFFIDHVDTYWCIKARSQGYTLLGVRDAKAEHCLGNQQPINIPFTGRKVFLHNPDRLFFQIRNAIYIFKRLKSAPINWRLILLARALQQALFNILFVPKRRRRLYAIVRGLLDGVRN